MSILPLTCTTLVFRSKPRFQGLPHVVNSVSMFLDSSVDLSLLDACKFHSVKLLERIWNSSEIFERDFAHSEAKWTLRRFLRIDKHYRQYLFSKVMEDAVSRQDLEMVKWLSSKFQGCTIRSKVVARACEAGAMDILQFFYNNDSRILEERGTIERGHPTEWGGLTMSAAIKGRRSDIVWWLHRYIPDANYDLNAALISSLEMGDVLVAEWLTSQGVRCPDINNIPLVISNGRLDVLQWLMEGQLVSVVFLLPQAAAHGHMEMVRWIIENNPSDQRELAVIVVTLAIHTAVIHGHLEMAKFLHEFAKNSRWIAGMTEAQVMAIVLISPETRKVSSETMITATMRGFIDSVRWLYAEYGSNSATNIFECSERQPGTIAMDVAAANGHLDVLKFLHELQVSGDNRVVCTKNVMNHAAANGHLNVVQWLHENREEGCSTAAMDGAAGNGKLDVAQWLHENRTEGCTREAIDKASMFGHLEAIKWLHVNRTEGCTNRAMDNAAMLGKLEMVKWLHFNRSEGCTQEAMDEAAAHGFLDVVKWLHINRTEGCTVRAMNGAAENGHLKVVQWLHASRSEGCTTTAVNKAAAFGHFEVLLFLHFNCHIDCTEEVALRTLQNEHLDVHTWVLDRYPAYRDIVAGD